jgi:NAD(P)-dependent dehydrogenase (short-subunit alcohol dehydrogenase family)
VCLHIEGAHVSCRRESDVPEPRNFGGDVPMKRVGEPSEVAPCFVFLASDGASYMSGQVLHPNGGEVVRA